MDAIRFQAKFLIASPDRILHPAQMVVRHGKVIEISESTRERADIDLGDQLLCPGLINPHTHLEFSDLHRPLPAGQSFPEWIRAVLAYRRETQLTKGGIQNAIANGLRESFDNGCAVVADIVTQPWQPDWLPTIDHFYGLGETASETAPAVALSREAFEEHLASLAYPRLMPFPELIGLQPERMLESCQWAEHVLAEVGRGSNDWIAACGLSPHAPYSLDLSVVRSLIQKRSAVPVLAMHVAESSDELMWLDHRQGAFQETFERLGLPAPREIPSIRDCIALLAEPARALLIHGNYLSMEHVEQIAAAKSISVVYCPRTHAHFGHPQYPLDALRAAGIRVVLGTDSRATNPDLKLWDEVQTVRQRHPWMSPRDLLESVTLGPAVALGIASGFGSLEVGKQAFANVLPVACEWTPDNLLDALTATPSRQLGWSSLVPETLSSVRS